MTFRKVGDSPKARREFAVAVGGTAAGAAVGLVAAMWGLIHPFPGLVFLGMAIAAVLMLVVLIVLLPALSILRQEATAVE